MFKLFIMGLVMGLVLSLVIGIGASRVQEKSAEQIKYEKELPDATPVQSRVLTERQRVHSSRFTFYRKGGPRMISELAARAKAKGHMTAEKVVMPGDIQRIEPVAPETFFGELTRESDAVIRGKVKKKTSQVTEDEAFLFTDYDVAVEEVFKDNIAAPLALGTVITVTRPGGKVLLDGVIVTATDRIWLPLPTNGQDIVLYLKFLPETGAYYAVRGDTAYEIDGTLVQPLTQARLPLGIVQNRDSFLGTVRTVSSK